MLVKKLIPLKFMGLMIEIVISALMLATRGVYPVLSAATTDARYLHNHVVSLQGALSSSHSALFKSYLRFLASTYSTFAFISKVWSGLLRFSVQLVVLWTLGLVLLWLVAQGVRVGDLGSPLVTICLLSIYPLLNELFGMISNICHNQKLVF